MHYEDVLRWSREERWGYSDDFLRRVVGVASLLGYNRLQHLQDAEEGRVWGEAFSWTEDPDIADAVIDYSRWLRKRTR